MLWVTLFNKIGKQQMRYMQRNHVYALLNNPKTHETEKVYLALKYDTSGHPFLIKEEKRHDKKKGMRPGGAKR